MLLGLICLRESWLHPQLQEFARVCLANQHIPLIKEWAEELGVCGHESQIPAQSPGRPLLGQIMLTQLTRGSHSTVPTARKLLPHSDYSVIKVGYTPSHQEPRLLCCGIPATPQAHSCLLQVEEQVHPASSLEVTCVPSTLLNEQAPPTCRRTWPKSKQKTDQG